jgi:membrane-anchored protein YejM (alkaline phosphatase superfamily)
LIILTEKFTYGTLSLLQNNEYVSKFKVIPLYQPLTFNRLAAKYFNYEAPQELQNRIDTDALVNYPLNPLELPQELNKFNIIIIVSDAVKNSELNKDTAPNIEMFKKESIVFENHFSGGNATRFGIFSILYGLNSTYWFSFLNANKGPVLVDALNKSSYDINIISSTNASWPEFRKTAYSNVAQDAIKDDFEGSPWQKDEQSTQYFIDKIEQQENGKPFFKFVFLDAPHGYSYPPYTNKFNASGENVNYLAATKGSKETEASHARYKNAIYFNDLMFAKMMDKLKEKKMYDESLIIYTSDHGQEFYEYGFYGHNSAFNKAQVNSPLIVKLPKSLQDKVQIPKKYPNILTSHNDIVPSIFHLLGIDAPSSNYSNGYNIFDVNYDREYIFTANWNNNAIVTKKYTYVFSNLPNKMFKNEVRYTDTYQKVDKEVQLESKILLDIMNQNRKFLK